MNGIKALLASEKAIAAGVLVIAATVFVILGKMTVAEWREFSTWILGIYVAGKTVQGTAAVFAPKQPDNGIGTSPNGIGTSPPPKQSATAAGEIG